MGQNIHKFEGKHVFGELYGVSEEKLNNYKLLQEALEKGIKNSGAHLAKPIQGKQFEPSGVTLLGLLEESHTSIHTYPEEGAIFFDAFTCGESDPTKIMDALVEALEPEEVDFQVITRGRVRPSIETNINIGFDSINNQQFVKVEELIPVGAK